MEKTSRKQTVAGFCLLLVSDLPNSYNAKMYALCSSERLEYFRTIRRHNSGNHTVHSKHCQNLKSNKLIRWHSNKTGATKTVRNKNFWEELIAYFLWYDTGHIENDASNNSVAASVFFTAVTFLPSCCLATTGGFLLSRCLATIRGFLSSHSLATIGGIHRQTETQTRSNVIP
jgi:hypothetical protein